MQRVPEINVIWNDQKQCPQQMMQADISVAVATDSGLITPIVNDAANLGLLEISNKVKVSITRLFAYINNFLIVK